jgi:LPXTG-site transpeptidase (sortase) family protein
MQYFKGVKKLWKAFAIFFIIAFFVINWDTVSWVFNYKALSRYFSDRFNGNSAQNFENSIVKSEATSSVVVIENTVLEIPRIEISVPVTVDKNLNDSQVYKALDFGPVYYPSSALPGQPGQTIILGHSAPPNWPHIKYDWIFSQISTLENGDVIFLNYNNQKLKYSVINKTIIEKGGDLPEISGAKNNNVLFLVSCWPPGKDLRRIAVQAQQVD